MARPLEYDATIQTRIDSETLRKAKLAASKDGKPLSAYLRDALNRLAQGVA